MPPNNNRQKIFSLETYTTQIIVPRLQTSIKLPSVGEMFTTGLFTLI